MPGGMEMVIGRSVLIEGVDTGWIEGTSGGFLLRV